MRVTKEIAMKNVRRELYLYCLPTSIYINRPKREFHLQVARKIIAACSIIISYLFALTIQKFT